jgi:hypothetical protein
MRAHPELVNFTSAASTGRLAGIGHRGLQPGFVVCRLMAYAIGV